MLVSAPEDLGNTTGPWWVSAGAIVVGILTAVSPPLLTRWRDRRSSPEDDGGRPGLNAPVVATVTETTKPRGMSGIQLTAMLQTVDLLSDRLGTVEADLRDTKAELLDANAKISELERHDSQKQWAYDQAIDWGVNALGDPPREIPGFLRQYMTPRPPA